MTTFYILIAILYQILFVPFVCGWTSAIHSEIAWMAFRTANKDGKRFMKHHLGDDVMRIAEAASWADSDDAKARYPDSEDYHFSHTPYKSCAKFDLKRDCGFRGSGRCLVTGIAQMVMRAIDPSLPVIERGDALKFVLHLVADIHQPLHTGFARDAGGVHIPLNVDPAMSLHQYWDLGLMQNVSVIGHELSGAMSEDSKIPSLGDRIVSRESVIIFASALATESTTMYTCKHAYTGESGRYILPNEAIGTEYIESRSVIIRGRIQDAISRLASLIDVMGATFFQRKSEQSAARKKIKQTSSAIIGAQSTNSFSSLEIDFDIDEVVDLCEESRELYQRRLSPVKTDVVAPGKMKVGEKSEYEFLEEAIAAATRDRLRIESEATCADINYSQEMKIGDIDISSFTLARRPRAFLITHKDILARDPSYDATRVHRFNVRLVNGKRVRFESFGIDSSILGNYLPVLADCEKILRYLRTGEAPKLDAQVTVSQRKFFLNPVFNGVGRVVVDGMINIVPLSNTTEDHLLERWVRQYVAEERANHQYWEANRARWPDITHKWDYDFYTKFSSIVMYTKGNIVGYFLKEDLANSTLTHRRVNVFVVEDSGFSQHPEFYLLMDTRIFDGLPTPRIHTGLNRIDRMRVSQSDPITHGSSLPKEFHDLNRLLNKNKAVSLKMKTIKNLIQYPCPYDQHTGMVLGYDFLPQLHTFDEI